MKFVNRANVFYCALSTQFAFVGLQLLLVNSVLSMSTEEAYDYDDSLGSGNISYANHTPEMTPCQCNHTNLMVNRKFLLRWLNVAKDHSISKLSTAAHILKIDTEYLQVSSIVHIIMHRTI